MAKVAVVGAGMIGCAVGLHLLQLSEEEKKQLQVTIIADKFTPHTTSDRSTAIALPFDVIPPTATGGGWVEGVGDPSQWLRDTVSHLRTLHDSPDGGKMGISLVHGIRATDDEDINEVPWWSEQAYGFTEASTEERTLFNIPPEYKTAASFSAFIVDSRLYLPQLLEKFRGRGGKTVQRKVTSLSELSEDYDIIINCSGLGAAEIVPDSSVYPVKGNAVSVQAPWIKQFVILESGGKITSVIPRTTDVLLGVTAIPHDYSTDVDPAVTDMLVSNCTKIVPSLKSAKVLESWVGLRPMRSRVRVCRDISYRDAVVIHCYGHGSKGMCYHWGCALEVGRLVSDALN